MVGASRLSLRMLGFALIVAPLGAALADGPEAKTKTKAKDDSKPPAEAPKATGRALNPLGDDLPGEFVPLHPRTAEDRERIEALRDYAMARSLEDRRKLFAAIELLEEALKKQPDSVPILRRLASMNRARGKVEKAAEYSRKALELDPGDTETIGFLSRYHIEKNDPAGAEAMLNSVLNNPELERGSAGYLLAAKELGNLYDALSQPAKAADAVAKLMDALDDDRAINALSPAESLRILGESPAVAFGHFGEILAKAHRFDLAVKAFRRGLSYDPDHPILPRLLAQTQLLSGKPDEALATLEPYLETDPEGREPYDLLAEILTALRRKDQIIPRLERAAKDDPKNLPLRYALADRYREAGQREKADEVYKDLIASQPDPQGIGALAASLRKEKKDDELIKLLGEAVQKRGGFEAVRPLVESIINDPDYADELLDAGLKLGEADPPKLDDSSRRVLYVIASQAKKFDKLVALRRQALKHEPSLANYRELVNDLIQGKQYGPLAEALEEMLDKYPEQKDGQNYYFLGMAYQITGQYDKAIEAAGEALKLNPADSRALEVIAATLTRQGKNDEAIAKYREILDKFPNDDEVARRAHAGLSTIYVELGQFEKGEAELEVLLKKDPNDDLINNDLGYLYADQGKNLEKAEEMIRKAVAAQPDNTAYLDSLGWVLFKRGKLKEAVEPLEKASKDPTADATIHDHLGDVYYQLKEHAKARDEWRKAEELAAKATPPDKHLPEIRKKLEALGKLGLAPKDASEVNP